MKEERLKICPKNVTDICMPKRDYDNRLMGPTIIIEVEFEKDILDPHIIIGGENIELRIKKERPTLCEICLQFEQPKKYYRSDREFGSNCAEHLQQGRMHNFRGNFCLYCEKPHKTGNKKICEEYKIEATIQYKMRLYKWDAYTAKETLGYRRRKSYISTVR